MIHAWAIPLWLGLAATPESPRFDQPSYVEPMARPERTAVAAEEPTPLPDVGDEDEDEDEDEAESENELKNESENEPENEPGNDGDEDEVMAAGDEAEIDFEGEPAPVGAPKAEFETGAGDEAEITFRGGDPEASGSAGRSSRTSSETATTSSGEEPNENKNKNKKFSFEVHGRVMAGGEIDNKRPSEEQDATPGVGRELFLRQARLKVRADYKKIFRVKMSIELADALKTPKIDRVAFLRNAYGEARFHDAARLRFGYFKRPFSRLELRGPSKLPFRGRGLANDRIIEDRNYGDRSAGGMLHGKIRPARLHYSAGVFVPALRTDGIDAVGRLQAKPLDWLSIGAGGLYKRIENGTGEMVDVAGASADVRIKYKGLYVLGDLVMGRDYLVPGEPWALGLVGYASYDIDLPKKLVLQPVLLAEWADIDIGISQNDAIRTIAGVNLVWRKRFRVMPQAEFIRPLGVTGNPWVDKDTYYLMLSLQL